MGQERNKTRGTNTSQHNHVIAIHHHVMSKQMELIWMDWLHVPPLTASRMSTRRLLRLLELIYFSNTFSQLQFDLACEEQK